MPLSITFLGLTITSSWGNGHATTYRALVRELTALGHRVTFLEHNKPWYATNRDMPSPPWGNTHLYDSLDDLHYRFDALLRDSDAVIVGSYVPQGIEVGHYIQRTARESGSLTAFYDIDTPVTLAALERNACEYLSPDLIPGYDLYLSFTGGPTLHHLEQHWDSPKAIPLYCSVDPFVYYPNTLDSQSEIRNPKSEIPPPPYDLAYLGTYSPDRQPTLSRLLIEPARRLPRHRFCIAGPMYPPPASPDPANIERIEHLPPSEHRAFYNRQRFTLNVTRADMLKAGWSPSVRIFEAAAAGTPIISDPWPGLSDFLTPGEDILTATSTEDVTEILTNFPESRRQQLAQSARAKILAHHTAAHRARELESYLLTSLRRPTPVIAADVTGVAPAVTPL